MTLVIADSEVREKTNLVCNNLKTMAEICDELANVLVAVTMPGGGLESHNMRDALEGRAVEAQLYAASMRTLAEEIGSQAACFLREIDAIDSFIY